MRNFRRSPKAALTIFYFVKAWTLSIRRNSVKSRSENATQYTKCESVANEWTEWEKKKQIFPEERQFKWWLKDESENDSSWRRMTSNLKNGPHQTNQQVPDRAILPFYYFICCYWIDRMSCYFAICCLLNVFVRETEARRSHLLLIYGLTVQKSSTKKNKWNVTIRSVIIVNNTFLIRCNTNSGFRFIALLECHLCFEVLKNK